MAALKNGVSGQANGDEPASAEFPIAASAEIEPLANYWSYPSEQLLRSLQSTSDGLRSEEAAQRRLRFGANTLTDQVRVTAVRLWIRQFRSPLVLILLFAAAVALLVQDVVNATTVLVIVIGSAFLGFVQEYRANAAMEALRARVTLETNVLRDGVRQRLAAIQLVPGDVVLLAAGTLIPADGIALDAKDLFVNQSAWASPCMAPSMSPNRPPISFCWSVGSTCCAAVSRKDARLSRTRSSTFRLRPAPTLAT